MSLKEKILSDFTVAFKAGDVQKKGTLSLIKATIQNKEIELGKKEDGLSDEEVISVLSSEAKKRKDSIFEYEKAGRDEQATQEKAELSIIETYLPEQMSRDEVSEELKKVILEVGTNDKREMGKIMGSAMSRMKGKADGTVVKEELEKLLS